MKRFNHYFRDVSKLTHIDIYLVCQLFNVDDSSGCLQHAIKKLLAAGSRGHKDLLTDLNEAVVSIQRKIDILTDGNHHGDKTQGDDIRQAEFDFYKESPNVLRTHRRRDSITIDYLKSKISYDSKQGIAFYVGNPTSQKSYIANSNNLEISKTIEIDGKKYDTLRMLYFYVKGYFPDKQLKLKGNTQTVGRYAINNIVEID